MKVMIVLFNEGGVGDGDSYTMELPAFPSAGDTFYFTHNGEEFETKIIKRDFAIHPSGEFKIELHVTTVLGAR